MNISDEVIEAVTGMHPEEREYPDDVRKDFHAAAEWARKEALTQVDLAAYGAVEKAALDWGAPILAILSEEGHDHECDALVLEDAAHCDCWWGRVRDVATGMSEVALLARGQIERIEDEGAPDGQQ